MRAGRELKANWTTTESVPEQSKLWEHMRSTKVVKDDVTSDVDTALEGGGRRLQATYDFALHTHGSIGPSCAIADFSDASAARAIGRHVLNSKTGRALYLSRRGHRH